MIIINDLQPQQPSFLAEAAFGIPCMGLDQAN